MARGEQVLCKHRIPRLIGTRRVVSSSEDVARSTLSPISKPGEGEGTEYALALGDVQLHPRMRWYLLDAGTIFLLCLTVDPCNSRGGCVGDVSTEEWDGWASAPG